MKYILPALLILFFCHPAQACLTRILKAPEAVEAYLKTKPVPPDTKLAALAESFQRDKAYYDATVLDFCTLRMDVGAQAQEAQAEADQKIMDTLITKWQKIGAAEAPHAPPAPKACKTAEDCNDFCKGVGADKECLPDGVANCVNSQCGCALTCR